MIPILIVAQKLIDVKKEKVIATMIASVWMDSNVITSWTIVLQVFHDQTMTVATNHR